jgi:hypothetical protein
VAGEAAGGGGGGRHRVARRRWAGEKGGLAGNSGRYRLFRVMPYYFSVI